MHSFPFADIMHSNIIFFFIHLTYTCVLFLSRRCSFASFSFCDLHIISTYDTHTFAYYMKRAGQNKIHICSERPDFYIFYMKMSFQKTHIVSVEHITLYFYDIHYSKPYNRSSNVARSNFFPLRVSLYFLATFAVFFSIFRGFFRD